MKSKKFLAALAAVAAVSAVATSGLTAKADEEVVIDAAPEVAAPVAVETPAAPVAPVVSEPVVTEAAPVEPAEVVEVETPAAPVEEAAAVETPEAPAEEATEEVAEETTEEEVAEEDVTEEIPDAEKLEDHNGYNMSELAKISTEASITKEKAAAVDYNKIYTDYVNDTIVKKIDVAALEPDTKNPEKDYVRKELLGLVSAQIYDFGNDGVDELVTVTREQVGHYDTTDKSTSDPTKNLADFMVNVYQYDRDNDAVNLIGRQSLGSYDLTYAGYSRPWGTSAYSDFGSLAGENDSQFQLAIVGDSIYFVQEQNTDLKDQDDKDPNANRITHKIFTVNANKVYNAETGRYETRNLAKTYGLDKADDVYGKDVEGGAVSSPYVLNINRTTVTDNNSGLLYVNADRYKKLTGNDFAGGTAKFTTQQAVTNYIRDQFATMKVPVNYAFLVDDVYNDDTIYADVRFAQDDVTMLTQYNTSPNFTTIDFTGIRGNAHPAGTSEKKSGSGSSNGGSSSSSNNGGTTSSPNTGDSRVPVAAGAAAVAAAAAAVAFVSKKRG